MGLELYYIMTRLHFPHLQGIVNYLSQIKIIKNLWFSQYGELYSYRPNMLLDEYSEWVTDTGCSYSTQQRSKDVNEKISTIHFLKEYMDNELYSAIKCSNDTGRLTDDGFLLNSKRNDPDFLGRKLSGYTESDDSCEDSTHPSRRSSNAPSLTHILDFQRFDDALLIFLSDGTCQVLYSGTTK